MIQIILLILKVMGIALLVILGILLFLLAIVLFVPVFYRVRIIRSPEETKLTARISYLFPLFLATIQYLKKLSYKIRIFGFVFLDSEKPKKEKRKKNKGKNSPETIQAQGDVWQTQSPKLTVSKEEAEEEDTFLPLTQEAPVSPTGAEQTEKKEKKVFFEKIKGIWRKVRKIGETIRRVIRKISKLLHQKEALQEMLSKQENRKAIRFAWDKMKHLLKHILPRKMKGYLAFGTGDPATTGQALGAVSVLYAKTGCLLEIRPNFTEKQLECDMELKGRIQVFSLLMIVAKVYFSQEIKNLITEFKNIKEIE